jgi:hypothetical protein
MTEARTLEVAWASLGITPSRICEAWGTGNTPWAATVEGVLDPLLASAADLAPFRAGWCTVPDVAVDPVAGEVRVATQRFRPGTIVTQQLEGSRGLLVFAATLGGAFDDWVAGLLASGDAFLAYAADTIGAVTVEAVADVLAARMEDECARVGEGCTRRLSPGYCGWDVAEQHALFALLPDAFCGIRLNPSAMMVPKKSVSGIVGTGPGVAKAAYPCATCDRTDCLARPG